MWDRARRLSIRWLVWPFAVLAPLSSGCVTGASVAEMPASPSRFASADATDGTAERDARDVLAAARATIEARGTATASHETIRKARVAIAREALVEANEAKQRVDVGEELRDELQRLAAGGGDGAHR